MASSFLQNANNRLTRIVAYKGDDQETLVIKKIWLVTVVTITFVSTIGSFQWLFQLGLKNMFIFQCIYFGYFTLLAVLFLWIRRGIEWFVFATSIFHILFSFVIVCIQGGIVASSGLVFVGWGGGPIYFLMLQKYSKWAIHVQVFFMLTVVVEILLQPYLTPDPDMSPGAALEIFSGFFLVITFAVFLMLRFFINQNAKIKESEKKRIQELADLKARFYTNISHEFRTPITVILGMAEQAADKPREYYHTGLKMIRRNANRLLHLVNQMLDLSKLEAGQMPLHFIQNDILSYLRYVAEPFQHLAGEKNVRFHFLTDFDEIRMDYDPEKIESLVGNLLSNALKHTPESTDVYFMVALVEGIAPPGHQAFSLFPFENKGSSGKNLSLKIKDTGPGIPEDQLDRIFDRFYQVNAPDDHKPEGTGIGLAIVKELVKLMGGNLFVKSAPGQGTEFTVYLPVKNEAPVTQPVLMEAAHENFTQAYPENGERIEKWQTHQELPHLLVIEDNPDVIQYIRAVLHGKYHLHIAQNGDDGIEKALASIPDIILSDVMMPGKDGFEVCRTLKNDLRTSHIPIILLTAKADIESRITGLEQGADAYLTKPFDSRELLVHLQKLIDLREKLKVKYLQMAINPPPQKDLAHPDEIFLGNLTEVLKTKLDDESFGTNELSHSLHISRIQLFRKLKAITGHSPSDLIRTYRLNKAKELLSSTNLNISEIAFEVGFKDPAYFTRAFTKEFGLTPSAIRPHHNG
jgi:signal transduction histidine kinase/DNA-binding response OmpR family regulator